MGTPQQVLFELAASREANRLRLASLAPKLFDALLHFSVCEQDANWKEAVALLPELADAMESARNAIDEVKDVAN